MDSKHSHQCPCDSHDLYKFILGKQLISHRFTLLEKREDCSTLFGNDWIFFSDDEALQLFVKLTRITWHTGTMVIVD